MIIVSLFDESGNMGRPWAENGDMVICVDIQNTGKRPELVNHFGSIFYFDWDLTDDKNLQRLAEFRPDVIFGFPPCTDLAVSGAAWFASKRDKNPKFQEEAVALARQVEKLGDICDSPWFVENPVSVLSTLWRKPDHSFLPYQYGGYLPEDDVHPRWPDYIAPRDRYRKKTCLWTGNGFIMPPTRSVGDPGAESLQHQKLGGKSAKTKQIRSETPRGFSIAVMEANRR